MLTAETIRAALDSELENELGYSKYDYKNKQTSNSRNGYSSLGDKMLVKVGTGNPETEIHTAVITSYNQGLPFQTSDVIYGYYVDGDTMYYSIYEDNAPNGVYKVNLAQYRNY